LPCTCLDHHEPESFKVDIVISNVKQSRSFYGYQFDKKEASIQMKWCSKEKTENIFEMDKTKSIDQKAIKPVQLNSFAVQLLPVDIAFERQQTRQQPWQQVLLFAVSSCLRCWRPETTNNSLSQPEWHLPTWSLSIGLQMYHTSPNN